MVVLATGCGSGSAEHVSDADRADARAYVAAGRAFDRRAQTLVQSADARTARTFHECSLVRLGDPRVPPLSRLVGITLVGYYQELLPTYRRYVERLAEIDAVDPELREVVTDARRLARSYRPILTARPDFCHTLRAWRAAGWTNAFSVMTAIGVDRAMFDDVGKPRLPAIVRAEAEIAASGDRMRELGVGKSGVTAFLLASDAFAAARGGYTEVADLAHR